MHHRPVQLEISRLNQPHQFHALKELLDPQRLYRKGTDPQYYLDCRDRQQADLLAVNLNLLGVGLQARVV